MRTHALGEPGAIDTRRRLCYEPVTAAAVANLGDALSGQSPLSRFRGHVKKRRERIMTLLRIVGLGTLILTLACGGAH